MKFIMFINVKMPTIVGILTFISMINITADSLKARSIFIFQHFSLYEQLKFHAQLIKYADFEWWVNSNYTVKH